MNRPYVICHMTLSIDGKVTGAFLANDKVAEGIECYYEINRNYNSDAFLCGKITMAESFTKGYYPDLKPYSGIKISRTDYIANNKAKRYAVACDRLGNLGWTSSMIEDSDPGYDQTHIIEVLTEQVKDEYLAYLKEIGASYIFAGKTDLNLNLALEKLYQLFNIRTLLLEGGSLINGAFMEANLIDELSLVILPITATTDDKPLFNKSIMKNFCLKKCEVRQNKIVYLNYRMEE